MKKPRHPAPAAALDTPASPWRWALAGALLGLLLVVVAGAPARWLAGALARASGGMVLLAEPQGSLWSGSARLVLAGGAGSHDSTALPGRVHWRLRPGWGALALRLNADCCTPAGPLDLRLSPRWGGARLAVADAHSVWPAALLAGLGTPFNTLQPQGELNLSTQALALQWQAGRASVQGQADVTLRQLSSRVATLRPLGSYRVQLRGGDTPTLALSTLEGPLRLSGEGQWVGQRLRFQGEASAEPGLEGALANLLNLLGRRQGERALMSFG